MDITAKYTLRQFDNSKDPNYAKALKVYIDNTMPAAATHSNEISMWLDRSYREFGDDLCILGFQRDRLIIGWVMLTFFAKQRLLVIDYLVLSEDQRSEGQYFVMAEFLKNWIIEEAKFEFDFVVAEVSFDTSGAVPSQRSIELVELFKRMGFAVADCEYHQAPLGDDNQESEMRAHLLVTSRTSIGSIKRNTLLKIVYTIYFDHNLRWYSAILPDPTKYEKALKGQYDRLESALASRSEIVVNGIKLPHPPMLLPRAPREAPNAKFLHPVLAFILAAALCLTLLFMQHHWNMPWQATVITLFACLIAIVTAFALFGTRGGKTLERLLNAFKGLFYNSK